MKRDYVIYPSMLGMKSGARLEHNGSPIAVLFDISHPLHIYADACSRSAACVWYVSPLWEFNDDPESIVAFLGDPRKSAPVSRQRFTSIVIEPEQSQAIITFQGVPNELVQIVTYIRGGGVLSLSCYVQQNGTGWAIVNPSFMSNCTGMS